MLTTYTDGVDSRLRIGVAAAATAATSAATVAADYDVNRSDNTTTASAKYM